MAMFDINGEEFFVGDTLKVIKGGFGFEVGTLVVCSYDDGSDCCRFNGVGGSPSGSRPVDGKQHTPEVITVVGAGGCVG